MRDFRLTLSGWKSQGDVLVKIDDFPAQLKTDGAGNLTCTHQTEKGFVNVKVYRLIDVGGPLWFLVQLFFFIIGIFGLFGTHRREKCLAIDFETDVELREVNYLTIKFNVATDGGRAAEMMTDLRVRELSNCYFTDAKAKKTYKILKIVKLLLSLAIVAAAIAATVLYIIL